MPSGMPSQGKFYSAKNLGEQQYVVELFLEDKNNIRKMLVIGKSVVFSLIRILKNLDTTGKIPCSVLLICDDESEVFPTHYEPEHAYLRKIYVAESFDCVAKSILDDECVLALF